MPKSKRDKKISLTQTRKKGLELKQKLIQDVRDTVDRYARIFTYTVHNMRNSKFKDIRLDWNHSRFFLGKNKVMMIALGRGCEDEYRDHLHKISRQLTGQRGLLFTNQSKDEVLQWFNTFSDPDYARSGNIATQTVILEEGPLKSFTHALEPHLRQLGLPTGLQKGVVTLLRDHELCKKGQTLTPEQCRILKLFGHKMAEFRITMESVWQNDGSFATIEDTRQEPVIAQKIKLKAPKGKGDSDDEEALGLTEMEAANESDNELSEDDVEEDASDE